MNFGSIARGCGFRAKAITADLIKINKSIPNFFVKLLKNCVKQTILNFLPTCTKLNDFIVFSLAVEIN